MYILRFRHDKMKNVGGAFSPPPAHLRTEPNMRLGVQTKVQIRKTTLSVFNILGFSILKCIIPSKAVKTVFG